MLAIERLSSIRELLNKNDSVTVAELSKLFNVTEETIRRDLERIVRSDSSVQRVHGGAYKIKTFDHEAPYQLRETLLVEEKARMAGQGLRLLAEGDTIMLDSSTSALYLAKAIKSAGIRLCIITNSLRISLELSDCTHISLIMTGGSYRAASRSFVGYATTAALSGFHADKAFVSCSGLHERYGLTDNSESEAQVRRRMLLNSDLRYLLVDSDKFSLSKIHHISSLQGIQAILTNKEPIGELKMVLEKEGIRIIIC